MNLLYKKNKKYLFISTHIIAWVLFYIFNVRLLIRADLPIFHINQIIIVLIYALVFYINYFIVTKLLLKKKYWIYIGFSLLLLIGGITGLTLLEENTHKRVRSQIPGTEFRPERPQGPPNDLKRFPRNSDGRIKKYFDNRKMFSKAYSLFFFFFLSRLGLSVIPLGPA